MPNSFEAALDASKPADTSAPPPQWIARLQEDSSFVPNALQPPPGNAVSNTEAEQSRIDQAYRDGEAAGCAAALAEQAEAEAIHSTFALAMDRLNAEATEVLRSALADTVAALCEQVIEPALIDRDALNRRCEAAVAKMADAPSRLKLHLHPDDLALVQRFNEEGIKLIADASLGRGAIRLESADGIISDSQEDWRRLLREALDQ